MTSILNHKHLRHGWLRNTNRDYNWLVSAFDRLFHVIMPAIGDVGLSVYSLPKLAVTAPPHIEIN